MSKPVTYVIKVVGQDRIKGAVEACCCMELSRE